MKDSQAPKELLKEATRLIHNAEELEDIETVGDVIEYLREKGIDE